MKTLLKIKKEIYLEKNIDKLEETEDKLGKFNHISNMTKNEYTNIKNIFYNND